jgi:hypothetical protein
MNNQVRLLRSLNPSTSEITHCFCAVAEQKNVPKATVEFQSNDNPYFFFLSDLILLCLLIFSRSLFFVPTNVTCVPTLQTIVRDLGLR